MPVLVGTDRFACGQRAERDFGVTVHVLDDGFQHLTLARDIDLLLVDESDLSDRVLPAGRLREPLANAAAAHAVLVTTDDAGAVAHVAHSLGVPVAFQVLRTIHTPRSLGHQAVAHASSDRVLGFAGIARPERFFADLSASGRHAAETMAFADHHPFTQKDVDRIVERARAVGASLALTTEKDAVRLEGLDFKGLQVQTIPLVRHDRAVASIPTWFFDRLRPSHDAAGTSHPHPRTPHQP